VLHHWPVSAGESFRSVAVDAYDRFVGRYSPGLARALIAAAQPGTRVLDVGCGPGSLTHALLAAGHEVSACDPSPPFVEACRARHPGVPVELAPAERLPYADAGFDGALAQLVVNFMTDAVQGVGEMRRVTRPGGAVAAAVWDYGGEMTLLRTFWDAAVALDPCAPDESAMRFSTPDDLLALWKRVGLSGAQVGETVVHASYSGFDDLFAPFEAGVGPAGAHTVTLDAEDRAALRAEFRRRLGVGDEPFELSARAWVVTGRA